MVNFADDIKNEEDYEIGWEWHEQDPGPMVTPYSGFRQCLLDPTKNQPEDFFDALFSTQMYTIMAEETNMSPTITLEVLPPHRSAGRAYSFHPQGVTAVVHGL